jgi:Phage tail-collar fibre protein
MADIFRWVLTPTGLAKKAIAEAGGARVAPTQFAVGDGGGAYHEPEDLVTGLINELWRGPINRIYVHQIYADLVVIEAIIPPDQPALGVDIREAAIYDADGDRIMVGKYPLTEKPAADSGGAKEIIIRGGLWISNGGDVVLEIAPSLAMATQEYVDEHAALTNPHSSTSAATADRLMLRDANGRAKVAAPAAGDDIARKDTVDAHAALTNPHTSTWFAAANRLMLRDDNGRSKVAAPAAADDIARKDTVDAHANAIAPHIGHIGHALATAVNDFLVASAPGAFVKKTLAEVKAILGLGDAAYKTTAQLLAAVYPIGSLYYNASDGTNPNGLLGFGTWAAFGAGRIPLAAGAGYAAGATGGEATHTLTVPEMPSHSHSMDWMTGENPAHGDPPAKWYGHQQVQTGATGGGLPHNNMPPYIVVYIWKRTE